VADRVLSGALGVAMDHDLDPTVLSARNPDPDRVPAAVAELFHAGVGVAELGIGQPSLDEVFLALTGHHAEQAVEEGAP
jgi:ABC-2 type transport system ATP-binding protein